MNTPAPDLTCLNGLLDALAAKLPSLRLEYPDVSDFVLAFAGEADVIEDQAGAHAPYVAKRLQDMLARYHAERTAPRMSTNTELQEAFALAEQVASWGSHRLKDLEIHTNDINHLAVASFCMVHEHQQATLALLKMNLVAPSMALMRPMLEAYVRGLWLVYATQDEFNRYQKGQDSLDLEKAIKLVRKRSGEERYSDLLPAWLSSKKSLHGFVHHSFQALIRHSDFMRTSIDDVVSTLNYSSALSTHASLEMTNIMDNDALPENKIRVRELVNTLQAELVATLMCLGLAKIQEDG